MLHVVVLRLACAEESLGEAVLRAGENVTVIGASTRRGHLVVERNNHTIHVPFQFLELRAAS